jgi:hypothetical protein
MTMIKEEILKGLEESLKTYDDLYDQNLDKMADYQGRIENLKELNTKTMQKMKQIADKIKEVKAK